MAPKPKQPTKSMEKPVVPKKLKSKKIKKKNNTNYSIYLYRLLKSVVQDKSMGISSNGMRIMNDMMNDMLERIASEAGRLTAHSKKRTLSSREIQTAVKLILPGELAKHANIEGMKALNMYHNNRAKDNE